MLCSLSVRNVVLIDRLDLDFAGGLSVLTGETGAGKSILLDSLGLVLGNRAETGLIRQGTDKLSVTAVFDLPPAGHPLYALAEEYDLELADALTVKRTLDVSGRGKIFINDQQVSLKTLKEFGRYLVEVHGQFDNQGLLNPSFHRDILDSYGKYPEALAEVREKYALYRQALEECRQFEENLRQAKTDEENLRSWADELEKLNPVAGEEEELTTRRSEMMNAEKLLENLNTAYDSLAGSADVLSAVRHAQAAVDRANRLVDGKYDALAEALEQTLINADESLRQIEEASASVNLSQSDIDRIEERLFALRAAARKHRTTIDGLPAMLEEMRRKLNGIELGEDGLEECRKKTAQCRQNYLAAAGVLSEKRRQAAAKLDWKVMAELPPLKMEKARFVTEVERLPETAWSENGMDAVTFTVSTNPNSPQGPLNKIASGGELARFMLALKVNLAETGGCQTMIFDEVDAGIGGATAQAVGERLARLAGCVQVLVVTHSPQVAACGNHHFKVEKKTENETTTTYVFELDKAARFEEIARMLAGEHITDEARAAAKVLLTA